MAETTFESEKLAPQLLLSRGVKVPVRAPLFFRLFGKKEIALTLFHPTGRTLLRMAELFLEADVDAAQEMNLKEAVAHYAKAGKKVHRIVALGFLNSTFRNRFNGLLGRWLAKRLDEHTFLYLYHLLMVHGGIEDFMSTIRLIGDTRITAPMNLSREEKTD